MRRERVLYQDKVALGEQAWETYEGAIRTCLKLYENTQDPYYKTLAFHYAEKSKSGALTQNLSDYRAKSFGIIPDALLELETSLKIDRSYYQGQIQQERAKATIDSARCFRLARYEDRLRRNSQRLSNGDYHTLKKAAGSTTPLNGIYLPTAFSSAGKNAFAKSQTPFGRPAFSWTDTMMIFE
jgi:hypothetical protein